MLPDGRTVWLFGDTLLGTISVDDTRPFDTPFIRNSLVVQNGTRVETLLRFDRVKPTSFFIPSSNPFAHLQFSEDNHVLLSSDQNEIALYAGHLISSFLEKEGITRQREIRTGAVNTKTDSLMLKYDSPVLLDEIASRLLFHSNNFIANQLLIAVGAKINGPRELLKKAYRH